MTSFSLSLFFFISACFFSAAAFSARMSDTERAACVVPFGTARSGFGIAAGAARIVVAEKRRVRRRVRVGKCILLRLWEVGWLVGGGSGDVLEVFW